MNPLALLKLVNPKVWLAVALLAVFATFTGYVYRKGGDAPRAELAAIRQASAVEAAHQLKNKERSDEEYSRKRAALERDLDRLRRRADLVPGTPASTSRPDLVAFDRAEFNRALREYRSGMDQIVGEGAKAVVDLDVSKDWARGN